MAYFGGTVSKRPWPRLDLRFVLLLLVSICGVIAAIVMARDSLMSQIAMMQTNSQQSQQQAPRSEVSAQAQQPVVQQKNMEVLVAAETIQAGARLRPAMFRLETRAVEAGAEQKFLINLNELEGSYTKISINQDTPLLKDSVATLNAAGDITERIPPGYRAVAIPVNIVTGVEGWVQPGARVDVVWTADNKGRLITTTLVENAQVLSAERRLENQATVEGDKAVPVPSHVTLLVTTSDSQRLQLAKNSGSLSLSLRGDNDVDPGNAATLTTDSIIKNKSSRTNSDIQGKVWMGGQQFVLSGSELIPQSQYEARARMKDPEPEN